MAQSLGQAPVDDPLDPGQPTNIIKAQSWRQWLTSLRTIVVALPTPVFTKSYNSGPQTITSAGTLTLAHGLGDVPGLVQVWLQCVTAELGYSVGDLLLVPPFLAVYNGTSNVSRGVSIVPDSTNLNIKFASVGANPMWSIIRKDTGVLDAITNANWKAIFRADA